MHLNDYQKRAAAYAGGFKTNADGQILCGLGLAGESGEVADLLKKRFFHPHRTITDAKIMDEMGDVLWYLGLLCHLLDRNLAEVARLNLEKLGARYPDGFPTC